MTSMDFVAVLPSEQLSLDDRIVAKSFCPCGCLYGTPFLDDTSKPRLAALLMITMLCLERLFSISTMQVLVLVPA